MCRPLIVSTAVLSAYRVIQIKSSRFARRVLLSAVIAITCVTPVYAPSLRDLVKQEISSKVSGARQEAINHVKVEIRGNRRAAYPRIYAQYDPVIETGWAGMSQGDVRTVLQPVYETLWTAFGHDAIDEQIRVYPRGDHPNVTILLDEQSKTARIGIASGNFYTMQFAYQFAHELGHLLANVEENDQPQFGWMDEMFAELASAWVLMQFSRASPFSYYTEAQWLGYYKTNYEQNYNEDLQRNYRISPNTKIDEWYPLYADRLERYEYERSLNWAFARELLPYFMAMPELWAQVGYLHKWKGENRDLRSFLSSWRSTLRKNGQDDTIVDIFKGRIPLEYRTALRHSASRQ